MSKDVAKHDGRTRPCPRLGHAVTFAYCRAPGQDMPCRSILDCWFETFDVQAFVARHWHPEDIEEILAPPPDRIATLLDLIEKARRPGRSDR